MKLGVIGAGNMATALVQGVLKAGVVSASDLFVSDLDEAKIEQMRALGVHAGTDNVAVLQSAEVILLAVKPDVYPRVLAQAAAAGAADRLYLSIAPGIATADMERHFSAPVRVIRTMPNTPAMVGEGMTMLCGGGEAREQDFAVAEAIFGAVGRTARLPEKLMDAAVALNGSSPVYVYLFIEAMADAAVSGGIPRALAYEAAAQSVLGSAKMVLETGLHPGALKDMVCSPAGTTIEAVKVLEEKGFRSAVIAAMDACTEKTKKMGK